MSLRMRLINEKIETSSKLNNNRSSGSNGSGNPDSSRNSASGGGNGTSNGSGSGARNSASNTERSGRRRHKSTRAHFRLGKRIWGVETSNSFESGIFRSRSRDGRKRKSGERTEVSGLSSADFSSNGGFPRARSESQSEYRFVGDVSFYYFFRHQAHRSFSSWVFFCR